MSGTVFMFIVLPVMLFFGGYLLVFKGQNSYEMWAGKIFACIIFIPLILLWWFLFLFSMNRNSSGGDDIYYYLIFPVSGIIYHYNKVLSFVAIILFYALFAYMKLKA